MRLHRFYVTQPLGEDVVIEEASLLKQWTQVFRYTDGNFVILFNGDGLDHRYTFSSVTKKACKLTHAEGMQATMPKRKSFLYLANIKKDAFEWTVQKAVELGITDIVPISTDHTEKKNLNYRRLETIIQEASEQSGRGDIPVLHESSSFKAILASLSLQGVLPSQVIFFTLLGEPWQNFVLTNIKKEDVSQGYQEDGSVASIIGPEGGWSKEEESFAEEHNFRRISLGRTTLRADTAGIVSSFLLQIL